MAQLSLVTLYAACLLAGCAEHRAPRPVGDTDLPRVGWVIMHGNRDNPDEEFGCQSTPRSSCAVRASAADNRVYSEVHLYFHPTNVDTTYTGVARVGFFRNAEDSPDMKIAATVQPGDVGNHSVVGIVTDKPGRYTLSLDITAVKKGGREEHFREEIPVILSYDLS